jgi:hypothetical protein
MTENLEKIYKILETKRALCSNYKARAIRQSGHLLRAAANDWLEIGPFGRAK